MFRSQIRFGKVHWEMHQSQSERRKAFHDVKCRSTSRFDTIGIADWVAVCCNSLSKLCNRNSLRQMQAKFQSNVFFSIWVLLRFAAVLLRYSNPSFSSPCISALKFKLLVGSCRLKTLTWECNAWACKKVLRIWGIPNSARDSGFFPRTWAVLC